MGPPRKPTPKHAATAKAIVDNAYRGADKRRRSNPKSTTVGAYVVTTSVLWKEEIFPGVMAGHKFDFETFNSLAIKKVTEKASKKGYAII